MKALATVVLLAAALAGCGGSDAVEGDLIVTADRVFDGRSLIEEGIVVVRGDEIVAVGRRDEIEASAPKRIDLGDATIVPGIVDLHVHDLGRGQRLSPVTTVRDVGAPEFALASVRDEPGEPHVTFAGPILTAPGGYPASVGLDEVAGIVRNVPEARVVVRRLAREGVSVIKVAVEWKGGADWPVLSPAELRAIVDEAHALGLPVTAHVTSMAAARRAFESGVDELAHMPCLGEDATLMRDLVAKGVEIVGTLHVRSERCPVLAYAQAFVRAGGTLLYGSDYLNPAIPPGLDAQELRLMVRAGLTPRETLTNATARAGEQIGSDKLGTLQPGAPADLVAIGGDAFADLGRLAVPDLLVVRGVVVIEGGRIAPRG
jgi:imidazolonepropionase-like amidohydrolase